MWHGGSALLIALEVRPETLRSAELQRLKQLVALSPSGQCRNASVWCVLVRACVCMREAHLSKECRPDVLVLRAADLLVRIWLLHAALIAYPLSASKLVGKARSHGLTQFFAWLVTASETTHKTQQRRHIRQRSLSACFL